MALFAEGLTAQVSARFSLSGLQFNVCGTMPICGTLDGKLASGCEAETETKELKNLRPGRLVGVGWERLGGGWAGQEGVALASERVRLL